MQHTIFMDEHGMNNNIMILESLLTLSAMLRGWVAQPRLARILQGTESSGICSSFSTVAISRVVCGRLNWIDNKSENNKISNQIALALI